MLFWESKTVLDSGFAPWIPDYRYWIPDFIRLSDPGFLDLYSRFQRPGFHISQQKFAGFRILFQWNLDSGFHSFGGSRFLDLYSRFQRPGFHIRSKNLMDSGFHGQKFPGFGNPDSLIWVRCCWSPPCTSAVFWFPKKLQGEKL